MGNSIRDSVKDTIRRTILDSSYIDSATQELRLKGDPTDIVCNIADEVFDILGMNETLQDMDMDSKGVKLTWMLEGKQKEVFMDCGAYKDQVCAIKDASVIKCGGDKFKCECPLELEQTIKELVSEWADTHAKEKRGGRR